MDKRRKSVVHCKQDPLGKETFMMNITIRQETISDYEHVYDLVKAAFTADDCPAPDEQELVIRLRKSPAFVPQLSLVAVQDGGRLAGHILFTEVKVSGHTLLGAGSALRFTGRAEPGSWR